jgi:hypothetical protein
MEWPIGTKLIHDLLPGIYEVAGPVVANEIGNRLVPVTTENDNLIYLHPHRLRRATDNEAVKHPSVPDRPNKSKSSKRMPELWEGNLFG